MLTVCMHSAVANNSKRDEKVFAFVVYFMMTHQISKRCHLELKLTLLLVYSLVVVANGEVSCLEFE